MEAVLTCLKNRQAPAPSLSWRRRVREGKTSLRWLGLAVLLLIPACQRVSPPELPYDQSQAESLRQDLDQLADP